MPTKDTANAIASFDQEYNLATRVLAKPGAPLTIIVANVKLRLVALRKNAPLMDQLADEVSVAGARKITPQNVLKLISALEKSYSSLNADLKELSKHVDAALKLPANQLSEADRKRVEALDILKKSANSLANSLKMGLQMRTATLTKLGSMEQSDKEQKRARLSQLHLGVRKSCDDSEALLKKLIAQPNEATLAAAFSTGNGLRSLGTARQGVVFVLKAFPEYTQSLENFFPIDSAKRLVKYGERKDLKFWRAQYDRAGTDPNWISGPAVEDAKRIIAAELPIWRKFAADVKTLYPA